jgi:hypothetical protein
VEIEFIRPILFGESILPYRVFRPFEGVLPAVRSGEVLSSAAAANRGFTGLHAWMQAAESIWDQYKTSSESFAEQLNHHGKLASQFPIPALRVVYAKAGTLPAACLVRDNSIVDHKLYRCTPASVAEAGYLSAILNSETSRSRVASLQSRGQWGARDFDKVMFNLPIPLFDPSVALHNDLAAAAREAERIAAAVELPETVKFQRARKLIRDALTDSGIAPRIDELVARLLDESPVSAEDAEEE